MKETVAAFLAFVFVGWTGVALGQGPEDFAARILPPEATGAPGGQVEVTVEFDFLNYEVQGYSIGICTRDESVAVASAAEWEGTDTATAKGGEPPDFRKVNVLPGGANIGVVVDFGMTGEMIKIQPTEHFSVMRITYDIAPDAQPEACTDLEVCDTLGTPEVITVVVVEGVSIPPGTIENGRICVAAGPKIDLHMAPADGSLLADKDDLEEVIVEARSQDALDLALQGWSYGIAHDGSKLELVEIRGSGDVMATNEGAGPDFYALDTAPAGGPGGTVGAVISLEPPFEDLPLPAGAVAPLETFAYRSVEDLSGEGLCCQEEPCPSETTSLAFNDQLGDPPVQNVLVIEGLSVDPVAQIGADLELVTPPCPPPGVVFMRGDPNNDMRVNIADGIWILNELFLPDAYPTNRTTCLDAADANADATIDASDAIYIFHWRLLDGPIPPAPGPLACGLADPVLGCDQSPCQ